MAAGRTRACPACTLLCSDAARRTCELCGCELPSVGFSRPLNENACIDLEENIIVATGEARECSSCTLICHDATRHRCEVCDTELPSLAPGLRPRKLQKLDSSESSQRSVASYFKPAGSPAKRSSNSPIEPLLLPPPAGPLPALPDKFSPQAAASTTSSNASKVTPAWSAATATAELVKPLSDFDPLQVSSAWPVCGKAVPYCHLAAALDALENTRSRLAKDTILTNAFRCMVASKVPAEEIEAACYLLAPAKDAQTGGHRLRPDWAEGGKPLSIPRSSISAALLESTGASKTEMSRLYSQLHEIGEVALALRERGGKQKLLRLPAPLMVGSVRRTLLGLADLSGAGVERAKTQRLLGLLRAAQGSETKWLVRTFLPHMAAGISLEASVLPALGAAILLQEKRQKQLASAEALRAAQEEVRTAYALRPDVRALVDALLENGLDGVRVHCTLHLGVPMQPMLAKACTSVPELLKRILGALPAGGCKASVCKDHVPEPIRLTAEFKYDGQRVQIHCLSSGEVKLFSRKLDDMTFKYPDVVAAVLRCARSQQPCVLDAEIVAVMTPGSKSATEEGEKSHKAEIAAFQSLSTRKRKHVTASNAAAASVAVKVFLFDMLFFGKEVLIDRTLQQRRTALREHFSEEADVMAYAEAVDLEVTSAIAAESPLQEALQRSVASSCEGLMVKRLDSLYEPSTKRSDCWLKLKKDYLQNMGDSLDLVPIGGWRGSGRKSRWISPWLMATYDPEDGTLGSVCRVMSGFSDQFYKENTIRYLGRELEVRKASAALDEGTGGKDGDEGDECEAGEYSMDEGSDQLDDSAGEAEHEQESFGSGGLLLRKQAPGVETLEQPQFWFQPTEVWEIRGADITISPKHMSAKGLVDPKRGLSVRFPRFMRKREDKRIADSTTPSQLAALFRRQTQQR